MKKGLITILVVLAMCLCAVLAFAEINTNWVDLRGIYAGAEINVRVGEEYYPVQFHFDGMAVSTEGGRLPVRSVLNLGTPQAERFNLATIAGQKAWYQALPAVLKPVAKDLRLQATNEDISE